MTEMMHRVTEYNDWEGEKWTTFAPATADNEQWVELVKRAEAVTEEEWGDPPVKYEGTIDADDARALARNSDAGYMERYRVVDVVDVAGIADPVTPEGWAALFYKTAGAPRRDQ